MSTRIETRRELGSHVVEALLPHRRPLLLVDGITSMAFEPKPQLLAFRHISANEDIFRAHFPGFHLWPGIFTIEGLGQTCQLLQTVFEIRKAWKDGGDDPDEVLKELWNVEMGHRLHPGFDPGRAERFRQRLGTSARHIGMSSAVEVRFLEPVYPGVRLDYRATRIAEIENMTRFDVEAEVAGVLVARGRLTAAHGFAIPGNGETP